MANQLSPELLAQLFAQESPDPFLTLITLSHPDFDADLQLVNNGYDVVSRGLTFMAFPMKIRFPVDDGESSRDFTIEFSNVGLELIQKIRSVTDQIGVKIEMILASMPNVVQISQEELKIQTLSYNVNKIVAKVILDNFLNTEMTCERYNPQNFPGLF